MVLKGPRFRVSPVRTDVVVGSLVVAASLAAGVELAVGVSSSKERSLVGWHLPWDFMSPPLPWLLVFFQPPLG